MYRLRNKFFRNILYAKGFDYCIHTVAPSLHLVQTDAKWIHSYQMPFGSIKMGFVKINVLCSPFERTVTNY